MYRIPHVSPPLYINTQSSYSRYTMPIFGCTQIYADNYNPDANTNDGSCILDCDYLITYESYVDLNYDNSISNYYCNYYLTNGTYTLEEAISYGYNCDCIEAGCTDETACNYDSSVTFDNGSCEYGCFMDDCVNYPVDFFDCSGNLSDFSRNALGFSLIFLRFSLNFPDISQFVF